MQPIMYQHPPPARQIPRMPYYQTPLHEIPETGSNLRELLGLMDRNQPINLDVLDDPPAGEKPNYSSPTLIKLASDDSSDRSSSDEYDSDESDDENDDDDSEENGIEGTKPPHPPPKSSHPEQLGGAPSIGHKQGSVNSTPRTRATTLKTSRSGASASSVSLGLGTGERFSISQRLGNSKSVEMLRRCKSMSVDLPPLPLIPQQYRPPSINNAVIFGIYTTSPARSKPPSPPKESTTSTIYDDVSQLSTREYHYIIIGGTLPTLHHGPTRRTHP